MAEPEKKYNKVQIVDEDDNVIGAEYMYDAIDMGAIRRASRIYVFDTEGKVLIQQRSKFIRKPLLYGESAAGQVDEGETYYETAVRELKEEIGLERVTLEEIVVSWRDPEYFTGIYRTVVPVGAKITFDPEEVEQVSWYTPEEVDTLVSQTPETCTPALVGVWNEFRDQLIPGNTSTNE